jgi:putative membrane protein
MTKKHVFTAAKCIIIVSAVIFIPLVYSLFYLGAFWDPYSRLDQLPVAVVNQDSGATIDNTSRNLGNEMIERLKTDKSLKWVFTDEKNADSGLLNRKYYAIITIPENFSKNISSAETTNKVAATINYRVNEKRNYLASQILNRAVLELEEKTRSSVDKELTGTLVKNLNQVPTKLNDLKTGLSKLNDGSLTAKNGVAELYKNDKKLNSGLSALNSGMSQLLDGSVTLNSNLYTLDNGLGQVLNGSKQLSSGVSSIPTLNAGITTLDGGAKKLAVGLQQATDGAKKLEDGTNSLPTLISGIDTLNTGAVGLSAGTNSYITSVNAMIDTISKNPTTVSQLLPIYASIPNTPAYAALKQQFGTLIAILSDPNAKSQFVNSGTAIMTGAAQVSSGTGTLKQSEAQLTQLQQGVVQLSAALQQLNTGASQISVGTGTLVQNQEKLTQLQQGITQLEQSLEQLKNGSSQLYTGSTQLKNGIATSKAGTSKLAGGSSQLLTGTAALKDGTAQINDGIKSALDGVNTSIADANSQLDKTKGLDTFASAPVTVNTTNTFPVPNYGTAFAPYFLSLSLWVGAIIIFIGIYLDPYEKMPRISRNSNNKILRVGAFMAMGFAQAIVLAFVIQNVLGLTITNVVGYYFSCILVSLVFTSIVEFLIVNLGDFGKFFSLLMLILQLTSCGGTFPMETVPKFFNYMYPFMPMTYSVGLFKEVISGAYADNFTYYNIFILAAIFVVFTTLSLTMSLTRKSKVKKANEVALLASES